MYERFTDRARKVLHLANEEAQRFNHDYIGTEHILLGLIKEGSGVAANVLKNLRVGLRRIRLEVERIVQPGPDMVSMGKQPMTPRAKKVVEYSKEEAGKLNHNYVGTEHLLLGLIREDGGVAGQVLLNLGLSVATIRDEILMLLGVSPESQALARGPIFGQDLATGAPPNPDDTLTGLARADGCLEFLLEFFNSIKAEAVATQNFDRAAHVRDMQQDLQRIREFLRRGQTQGE
jgi:ATP-dependent Clp protease ATP-binding subunit ClpA